MAAEAASPLRIERRGAADAAAAPALTRLRLNRPDKANALNPDLVEALLAAVSDAVSAGTRLLVLSGEGKHFCAGFDLADADRESDGDLLHRFVRIEQLLQAIHDAPFTTVAVVQGRAMGAGADLVAACSIRIGAANSLFSFPGARFGLVLGTRRLARRVGDDAARRIIERGTTLDAAAALSCGLLVETAESAEWSQRLEALAERIDWIDPATQARLQRCTRSDTNAQDMADLVESAVRPGLKERILAYARPRAPAAG
jgi:enoyl-CoA hydratase